MAPLKEPTPREGKNASISIKTLHFYFVIKRVLRYFIHM